MPATGPVLTSLADAYAEPPLFLNRFGGLRVVAATSNVSNNDRKVYRFDNFADALNNEVRSTWTSQDYNMLHTGFQQGHAHRIANVAGATYCVTVTKNIAFGANWVFNFHVWDSSNLTTPFTSINTGGVGVDLSGYLDPTSNQAGMKQLPWHFKSRVSGTTIEFAVWVDGDAEPAYGASGKSGSATIPAPYATLVGAHGIYVGHLLPGTGMAYDDIEIGGDPDVGTAVTSAFLTQASTDDYRATVTSEGGAVIQPDASKLAVLYAEAYNHDGTGITHWDAFKWDTGATWSTPDLGQWTDVSERVREISWQRGSESPLDRPRVGTATLSMDNRDSALSLWAGGGLYWLRIGTPVRFGAYVETTPGVWQAFPFFTGIVDTNVENTNSVDAQVDLGLIETTGALGAWNGAQQSPVGGGDTLDQRINRLLTDAGWAAGYEIDDDAIGDDATFQSTAMAQNRLAELYLTADSVGMRLFAASDGSLRMTPPYPPVGTVGTDRFSNIPTGDDLPIVSANLYSSRDRLINAAIAARAGGTEQVALDTVSIAKYGRYDQGGSRDDLIVQSDDTVDGMLQRIVYNFGSDVQGVELVSLDADMDNRLPEAMVRLASQGLEERMPFLFAWLHPSGNVYLNALVVDGMKHKITAVAPGTAMKWTATLSTATRIETQPLYWDIGHWDKAQWAL